MVQYFHLWSSCSSPIFFCRTIPKYATGLPPVVRGGQVATSILKSCINDWAWNKCRIQIRLEYKMLMNDKKIYASTESLTWQCRNLTERLALWLKMPLTVRLVWVRFPSRSNRTQCRERLATVATFFQRCVVQALCCGVGPRHSYHASA